MKKYISILATAFVLCMALSSCDVETDEPAGGTAIEKMCGHWVVTADIIEDGQIDEDPYGVGEWNLNTYNTANNDADVMWLSDNEFWGYTIKVPINYDAKTFSCQNVYIYTDDEGVDQYCTITEGKVIENGGLNVNGKPTDAIEYKVEFTDDPGTIYYIHGVRYAGF